MEIYIGWSLNYFEEYNIIDLYQCIDSFIDLSNLMWLIIVPYKGKGAFSRAIFLWQRSIVTETLAKYLRSHTATRSLKENLSKNLC